MTDLQKAEEQRSIDSSRVNWVRAAVLGANDGIVSMAALIVGVASAYAATGPLIVVGLAGLAAGALSMAVGEYVSVSSQRDIEKAMYKREQYELEHHPEEELDMLVKFYEQKGLAPDTARSVAEQLTAKDPIAAHAEMHGIVDEEEFTSPGQAAIASGISYTLGGAVPLLAILFAPTSSRILITFVAVLIALIITGIASARLSHANALKVVVRVLIGGALAMLITSGIGQLVKQAGL